MHTEVEPKQKTGHLRSGTFIAIAVAGYLFAIFGDVFLPIRGLWRPDTSLGLLWGVGVGFGIWGMSNLFAKKSEARSLNGLQSLPVLKRRFLIWLMVTPLVVFWTAVQCNAIPLSERLSRLPELLNPALMATAISLGILFPTPAQALFKPHGDERDRIVQIEAQAITLRGTIVLILAALTLTYYGPANLPAPVVLATVFCFVITLYSGALWWLERRAETEEIA